jgi:hypothetical protein
LTNCIFILITELFFKHTQTYKNNTHIHTLRHLDTDTQTQRHLKLQQAQTPTHTQTQRHTKNTHIHTNMQSYRCTDTQTNRQTDTQTHRLAKTQTHRHTDAQKHTHTPLTISLSHTQTNTHCLHAFGEKKLLYLLLNAKTSTFLPVHFF